MAWKDYIKSLEKEYIGKKAMFEGKEYTVVKVDYNGVLHINKPSNHNDTTAAFLPHDFKEA